MTWINYNEQKPPLGIPVLAYHHLWVDEDFNPKGIREGFLTDNLASDDSTYDFVSAHWWNEQDCYMTISKIEIEGHEQGYSENILNSIEPEYWMEIPEFTLPSKNSNSKDKALKFIEEHTRYRYIDGRCRGLDPDKEYYVEPWVEKEAIEIALKIK